MDEKDCQLTLQNMYQQHVLVQKGVKRIHIIAPKHATIVACRDFFEQAILQA